jgi:predicted XRE-type DNA-binding protein
VEKIVQKINIHNLYWFNSFFERLTLFTKLKNTLRQYGFSYRKIPDLLIHDEVDKSLVLNIRETYIKLFGLLKIKLMLSRRRRIPYFDKHKLLVRPDFFKLNNTFLKWKKYTIMCILRPYKMTLAIDNIVKLFRNKDLRIYWECFRRIKKIAQLIYSEKISSNKETLVYVIKKVNIQIK